MAFTQVTVTATFVNADGTIPGGTVTFTPTAAMANGGSIVPVSSRVLTLTGGTATVVLDANDDVGTTPSGTGYTVVEAIAGAASRTYTVVLARAQPSVSLASLAPATTTANFSYILTSQIGAVSGVASLDSGGKVPVAQVPDLSGTYAPVSRAWLGNRVAYLGDSITQGSWQNSTSFQSSCPPLYAGMLSSQRLLTVAVAGIAGNKVADMLARFDTDVTPSTPNVVHLLGGTNDCPVGITTLASFQASIIAIVAKIRAIGAKAVIGTIPPSNTAGNHVKITTFNAWLRRYAAQQGIPIVDYYGLLADPANGNYLAGYFSDGTHPNTAGQVAMGQLAANTLAPIMPSFKPPLTQDQADPVNLFNYNSINNCVLITDGGAGAPSGWFAYGGSSGFAHALVTDAAVPGKLMQITQTANASIRAMQRGTNSGITPGDILAVAGVITSDGGVTAQMKMTWTGAAGNPQISFQAAVTRGVYYQEMVVPAGATGWTIDVIAGAGTGVVAWGQPTVLNLTQLGIL